jgi:hypothetical protein
LRQLGGLRFVDGAAQRRLRGVFRRPGAR